MGMPFAITSAQDVWVRRRNTVVVVAALWYILLSLHLCRRNCFLDPGNCICMHPKWSASQSNLYH